MSDFVVHIEPASGASAPPNRPRSPSTTVEIAYEREIGSEETGQPLPPLHDVARGVLDETHAGSVLLPDPVAGSSADVRFLAGSGATKHTLLLQIPNVGSSAHLDLSSGDLAAITEPDPRPPELPQFVRRDAKLTPIGGAPLQFKGCTLLVAPVTVGDSGWTGLGLDKLFNLQAPATTAVGISSHIWQQLESQAWEQEDLAIDGQFTAFFRKGSGDSWLWWLTGAVAALGIQIDELDEPSIGLVSIVLPPLVAPVPGTPTTTVEGARPVPVAETEREVAENPEVYTEDPGAFCKPFNNPERVLGEQPFSVIFRAEQPVVSPEASIRTRTGPLLDFDLPELATVERDRRPSIGSRLRNVFGTGGPNLIGGIGSVVRLPALQPVVTLDPLPTVIIDDLLSGDRDRRPINAQHPVQWDSDASRYQAVTVARGHILEFRVKWRSNGYSLGTVAKTLTLAPRQVKLIQKIEWERIERTRRQERTQFIERVSDVVARQRQYDDMVEASLSEWSRGESRSSISAGAGGFGFAAAGFIIGGGGGHSNASSSASASGGRRTTASEEQRLRDSIRRYGESLRRFESVVVNEVTQEETVTGTAEVIRNPNYAHSLTVIYYQILRHLKIETAFAAVRECLFVPFAIKPFTLARAYRWRDLISKGILDNRFARAIRYLKDVLTGFASSDVPPGRRSDQRIRHVSGSLFISLGIARPRDTAEGNFDSTAWDVLHPYLGGQPATGIFAALKELVEARRDRIFQEQHAPHIAAGWVNTLEIRAGSTPLQADLTLATRYSFNGRVRVDFSATVAGSSLTREMLSSIRIRAMKNLPPGSVANLTRLSVTYQTDHFQRTFSVGQGANDLVIPETGVRDTNGAALFSLPDQWEREDVRAGMIRAVNDLLGHLNEHAEHYHKVIWWNMDRDRIYMLVDGFPVPGTEGFSIGSVIERDPIAIVGNSLVFRVSAGSFLGIDDLDDPIKLHNYYVAHQPISPPLLVSLPTDGLYAQAVMDECGALEEHYGSTDWILEEDEPLPPTIGAELLTTRRAEPVEATPTAFPQALINLQNAPEAPAPSGFAGLLAAITNANAFRDMAGLAGTQANAATGLTTAASLATSFGQQAAALKLAQLNANAQAAKEANQKLATVQRAVDRELVSPEKGMMEAEKILEGLRAPATPPPHEDSRIADAIRVAASRPGSQIEATTPEGQVRVSLASTGSTQFVDRCGFRDLGGRILTVNTVRDAVVDAARAERDLWLGATGNLDRENNARIFGHLVRYWITERQQVTFGNLLAIAQASMAPGINYGQLLVLPPNPLPAAATITAEARRVAADLIVGVPDPNSPPNLARLVEDAVLDARQSRLNNTAWSGAFINNCIRTAEFNLNFEGNTGGREILLALSRYGRHWEYTLEAHRRRFGCRQADGSFDRACKREGTYHAFPTTRVVQEGDIIMQDRRDAIQLADVWTFNRIPDLRGLEMHGDIVVDVQPTFAETMGGNVTHSSRRRRYPLDPNGRLVVAENELFVAEDDAGVFPALPDVTADPLHGRSTARIFAVLGLVEECETIPLPSTGNQDIMVA